MVQIWDVVGFDEVADLQKMPKEVITTMKTYCESGTYQRGQEAAAGDASMAMFGNTNQPIEVMVQSGHLFEPMTTNRMRSMKAVTCSGVSFRISGFTRADGDWAFPARNVSTTLRQKAA